MEDVLRVYEQEPQSSAVVEPAVVEPAVVEPAVVEPAVVRLCFDERPCQLLDEVLAPLPLKQGKALRQDYEYERKGTACVLLAYDLDKGKRHVQVRERRTKKDYAEFMDWLVKEHYPKAQTIHLVQDNLNTHSMSSFYEHLPVERAGELAQKMQFHFTPKHGSWLNMAEIEFSALARQCLDRRIKDIPTLQREVLAWSEQRNEHAIKIHWSFTVNTARVTLASRYQKVNPNNIAIHNN
jgi:transposase